MQHSNNWSNLGRAKGYINYFPQYDQAPALGLRPSSSDFHQMPSFAWSDGQDPEQKSLLQAQVLTTPKRSTSAGSHSVPDHLRIDSRTMSNDLLDSQLQAKDKSSSSFGTSMSAGVLNRSEGFTGAALISDLLSDLSLPYNIPQPHLTVHESLEGMTSVDHIPSLSIPSRQSCAALLDIYHRVVSPVYCLYTQNELRRTLDDIFLTPDIARRDILETTLNSFALLLGHAATVMSRADASINELVYRCVRFTQTGLAQILRHADLAGAKTLLSLITINLRQELQDPLWYISGLVFSICIDLRYHLKRPPSQLSSQIDSGQEEEIRRVFWTAYCLDRSLSLAFGCPMFFREDVISCPYPNSVAPQVLARYKIRRLQSRIMPLNFSIAPNSVYPTTIETQLLTELNDWRQLAESIRHSEHGKALPKYILQEQVTQAGTTELLLHRRGIYQLNEYAIEQSICVALTTIDIYQHEALQMAIVEGILVTQNIAANLMTLLWIYRFVRPVALTQSLTGQVLANKVDICRWLLTQLSNRWSCAKEYLDILNAVHARIEA